MLKKVFSIFIMVSFLTVCFGVSQALSQNFAGSWQEVALTKDQAQAENDLLKRRKIKVEFSPINFPKIPGDDAIVQSGSVRDTKAAGTGEYTLGADDIVEITLLQPDKFSSVATISPDGYISFPYIGSVMVKGLTLSQMQNKIQSELADGYLKYPVVLVTLKESRSRRFFVYGEVTKPGVYPIEQNSTVLRAISMAGGFTKFGSTNRVKVLRARKDGPGYEMIKINIDAVMNGDSREDLLLKPEDIVVVSEGMF